MVVARRDEMSQRPFLVRDAAIKSVLVVNDLIGVRRRVRGCLDVHCSFAGVSIGEGFGRHGDDLPLCQLLQFHVGISTPRYGARDHFVVVVIAKKCMEVDVSPLGRCNHRFYLT